MTIGKTRAVGSFLAALACSGVTVAHGQAFNIETGPGAAALPSPSYGAVAGQAGQWTRGLRTGNTLTDINGNATSVMFGGSGTTATLSGIPNTNPDEQLFMSTAFLLNAGSSNYANVVGLDAGWYDLYLYCWTGTSVNGGNPLISVQTDGSNVQATPNCVAAWPGQQTLGITFERFTIQIKQPGSGISIAYGLASDRVAALSGLQIVPVPAPGASLTVLAGSVVGLLRRRR